MCIYSSDKFLVLVNRTEHIMFYSWERSSELRLESKQTSLSFDHCSHHAGFVATLGSMATSQSVVSAQRGLTVSACSVSHSTDVLLLRVVFSSPSKGELLFHYKYNTRPASGYFEPLTLLIKCVFHGKKAALLLLLWARRFNTKPIEWAQ